MLNSFQLKRYFFIFVVVNLIGIAVALILKSGLGCDPIGLLCDGISKFFSIQFGIAVLIIAFGVGTIISALVTGILVERLMIKRVQEF